MPLNLNRLKTARHKQNLTFAQLGKKAGISVGQMSRYEAGLNEPTADALAQLALHLQVSIDYLMGLVDEPTDHFIGSENTEVETHILEAYRQHGWAGVFQLGSEHLMKERLQQEGE